MGACSLCPDTCQRGRWPHAKAVMSRTPVAAHGSAPAARSNRDRSKREKRLEERQKRAHPGRAAQWAAMCGPYASRAGSTSAIAYTSRWAAEVRHTGALARVTLRSRRTRSNRRLERVTSPTVATPLKARTPPRQTTDLRIGIGVPSRTMSPTFTRTRFTWHRMVSRPAGLLRPNGGGTVRCQSPPAEGMMRWIMQPRQDLSLQSLG